MSRAQLTHVSANANGYGGAMPPQAAGPMMGTYGAANAQPLQPSDAHHINEVVSLNVGGQHFQTLYDTLANGNSRFFSHMFRIDNRTGRVVSFKQHIIEDEQGRIFINRDGRLFSYILQYLRDGTKMILPENIELLRQLSREAEFFAIERFRTQILEKLADEEQRRMMRDERLDSIASTVQQISQQLYVTTFKK